LPDKYEILVELLRDVNHGMVKRVREVLAQHELPFTMMIISKQIAHEPGITISELARRTGIAKSHISNNIRALNQRGWVEKRGDNADQRLMRLYLTEPALEHFMLMKKEIKRELSSLVSDITEERALNLIDGLQEIKAALAQGEPDKKSRHE